MPSFQSGASASLNVISASSSRTPCGASSGYCRQVPDVAADADPNTGYAVYYGGSWGSIGGTSGAAPTWAALVALADASPGCASAPVGFLNAALYSAAGGGYGATFDDVTNGGNSYGLSGGFSAGTAYDMTTGLGTPNGVGLVTALCGPLSTTTTTSSSSSSSSTTSSTTTTTTTSTSAAQSSTTSSTASTSTATSTSAPTTTAVVATTSTATTSTRTTTSTATTISPPAAPHVVTLTVPAKVLAHVGAPLHVTVRARDGGGLPVAFAARSLPAGLSIDAHTGTISGTPRQVGRSTVVVYAADASGGLAQASIAFTVAGAPKLRTDISRLPSLALTLNAGRDAPAVANIRLGIHGVTIARHWRAAVRVDGHAIRAAVTVTGTTLYVRLGHTGQAVLITLSGASVPRRAGHRQIRAEVRVSGSVRDASGYLTSV